jgi:elongation factor 1-beta
MGKVEVVTQVLPSSAEVDLEELKTKIKAALPSNIILQSMKVEPYAFGLSIVKINLLMDDAGGGPDLVEEALLKIKDVGAIRFEEINRLF